MTSQEQRAREVLSQASGLVLAPSERACVLRAMLALAAEVREECAVAARNALVAYEWPPQDGDAQCDAVLAAIRAQGGER